MKGFLVSGGSVPGYDHTKPGQPGWTNNQDAFSIRKGEDYIVAVVCDGCSSAPHSEVGAKLGAELVSNFLVDALTNTNTQQWESMTKIENGLADINLLMPGSLSQIAEQLGDVVAYEHYRDQVLLDYFLFTIVGVVIAPDVTVFFSLGDGVVALNDTVNVLPDYEGNAPPYLAYRAMRSVKYPGSLETQIVAICNTKDVSSVLIGTDGVNHLIQAAQQPLPGKKELVGPLSQFWTEPKFVKNPDTIRRRLALANNDWVDDGRIRHGLLPDDTTLVVVQREKGEE